MSRRSTRRSEPADTPASGISRQRSRKRHTHGCASRRPEGAAQMTHVPASDVTQLLRAWGDGDRSAEEALLRAVHDELHHQAARAMRRESPDHTLQPTALVNEAYLRLVDKRHVEWRNRAHFFGIAAQVMRRILVDHARGRLSAKRGGGMQRLTIGDVDPADASCDSAQEDRKS